MISSAPFIFAVTWVIGGILIWCFVRWQYSERIKAAFQTIELYKNLSSLPNKVQSTNRALTQLQKNILSSEFRALGEDVSISVYPYPGVSDARILCDQFHILFNEAGWGINIESGIIPDSKYSVGIWLVGNLDSKPFKDIQSALTKSELTFRADHDPTESEPFLVIGEKE
jgi:hypothetical protein